MSTCRGVFDPATILFMNPQAPFTTVEEAIEEIRAGRMIVVVDDEDRENEGDLTLAAEKVTPKAINFMAKYGRGLICLALTEERLDYLRIGPMTAINDSPYGTAFCESIEAREGVTTGISAHDRARTIQVAVDPQSRPSDLVRPGHVFPLRARKGGVLVEIRVRGALSRWGETVDQPPPGWCGPGRGQRSRWLRLPWLRCFHKRPCHKASR